jgi:hypothetical protein
MCFVPYLLVQILTLVLKATCYGRFFEIVIRGGFASIGCVSMVQDGFSGHGLRYLKKYAAACLQGAVIMGALVVGGKMTSSIMLGAFGGGSVTNMGQLLGASFTSAIVVLTEVMFCLKANSVANDIAGV